MLVTITIFQEKKDNSRKTGTGGGKKRQLHEADDMILEIVGRESPVIEGLAVRESDQTEMLTIAEPEIAVEESSKLCMSRKRKLTDPALEERRKLQIGLLKLEIYNKKLEIKEKEQRLGIISETVDEIFELRDV